MVFPSIPVYVDTPNWNQQQQLHLPVENTGNSTRSDHSAIPLPPIALTPPLPNFSAQDPSSLTAEGIRPTRFPHPESGLNCPRCNSTNTKFCYFNNYSLSQPRHFCRACRRYWTRGGTLRNVPVGGGSRRNRKRHKTTTSITASACTSKNQYSNSIHHFGTTSSSGTDLGESNMGLTYSGMQMQFPQIQLTGAIETTHALPIQLGPSSHLGLRSRTEELLHVCTYIDGNGLGYNRDGSHASLPCFNSSSSAIAIQTHSLFNTSDNYKECFTK